MTAPNGLHSATETWLGRPPETPGAMVSPAVVSGPRTPAGGESRVEAGSANTPPAGVTKPRRSRMSAASAAPDISENEFLAQVRALAKLTGWEFYHTWSSKFSEAGWPDCVLASATQRRTLFVELKKRTGKVSAAQQKWLDLLALCGHEVAVWRPADLPEIAKILRGQRIESAS